MAVPEKKRKARWDSDPSGLCCFSRFQLRAEIAQGLSLNECGEFLPAEDTCDAAEHTQYDIAASQQAGPVLKQGEGLKRKG